MSTVPINTQPSGAIHDQPMGRGGGGACGGPATVPSPAPNGVWRFVLPDAATWQGANGANGANADTGVDVAVLDTWPDLAPFTGDVGTDAAVTRMYDSNSALQEFVGYLRAGRISTNAFAKPADTPPYRSNAAPDHGLFVADIVHRIAPHAGLHLLHVLDDRGYGRGGLILDALDYCLNALVRPDRRLVINLSLFLLVPPRDAPDAASASVSAEELARKVKTRVARLIAAGAVVVAAAGNDALDYERELGVQQPVHLDPRLPADCDGVICVVATDRGGKLAAYSNHADTRKHNSIATWGGQGVLVSDDAAAPRRLPDAVAPGEPGSDERDGVVSLYVQPSVQTSDGRGVGAPNTTGWAYWSGTSFATPIIGGIAANLLARDMRLTHDDILRALREMAAPAQRSLADAELGCPFVPVRQERW